MIDVRPIENSNIFVNQDKTPRHLQKLVEFILVLCIKSELKTKYRVDVNVNIVSENFIQKLNHKYRNKDKPTNTLSFPCDALDADLDGPRELGDIFLCLPYIENEAKELEKPPLDHFAHLLVHSCLHLLGYDHELDKDFERMKYKEIKILHKMKIPNPYL
jgi:probable rRNA maturation factor